MTDQASYPVEVSVSSGSGLAEVVLVRQKPAGMDPCRAPVEAAGETLLRCEAALSAGRNLFSLYGVNARGRKVRGPSFRIFKTSAGIAPSSPVPARPSAPLPFLQPAPLPGERKSTPPVIAPPSREFGQGRCGHPIYQTMSIPVVENGRTRYVDFKTDGNGCLPAEVPLK